MHPYTEEHDLRDEVISCLRNKQEGDHNVWVLVVLPGHRLVVHVDVDPTHEPTQNRKNTENGEGRTKRKV